MLPPERRLPDADRWLAQGAWFVVHAPRQTGKTTTMKALARRVTAEGRYAGLYFTCESARATPEDVGATERALWSAAEESARYTLPAELQPPARREADPGAFLRAQLVAWAEACPRPLVLIFDEIDALAGRALKSVLSQLRDGFNGRDARPFPHSVILCGLRDVRDYRLEDDSRFGSSSPFNIKTISWRLGDFSQRELAELTGQHSAETGQPFTAEALDRAWELTRGQPWLVNALAAEAVLLSEAPGPVGLTQIEEAKERLIRARQTHLDSLLARLQEGRVRRVLEPIISGGLLQGSSLDDDFRYVVDLGLVSPEHPPQISNAIYREVILRVLAAPVEMNVTADAHRYVLSDGRLDLRGLLEGFLDFWRQHGEILARGLGYQEAAPQLVLMAWLHRVVNGGGSLEREVGVGRGRIDLLIRWPFRGTDGQRKVQREALEVKVWRDRDRQGDPTEEGLRQLDRYLTRLGLEHGALVVLDDRAGKGALQERAGIERQETASGRAVWVVRG